MELDKRTQKRSASVQKAPSRERGPVYHTETLPAVRSASSKSRSNSTQSDRPQHPSLSRVKGRNNMYTPPRNGPERSWLNDQSPVRGVRTPPQHFRTPESGTPTLINPTSSLLQGLLKEERAHRGSRGSASEHGAESPRTPDRPRAQEDTASEKARKISQFPAGNAPHLKDMGVREMDQYVSKMTKLNFDLKLEIFHRTQQMGVMEKKLERMYAMEEELTRLQGLEKEVMELRAVNKRNQGLREANSQLRTELDTKDKAVEEAVQWICKLEAENEQLKTNGRTSQLSMNRLVLDGPSASSPKNQIVIDIPERTSSKRARAVIMSPELRQLSKAPSFLRDDNKSTATLRSLYVPDNNISRSAMSQLTKSESVHTMTDTLEPGSPRLSVLSECSELHPFDTPTKWNDFDNLDIPVRKASSESVDSYATAADQEESKEEQIDRWIQSRTESQTIIRRRQTRAASDASKNSAHMFTADLYSNEPRGRGRLDASLFGGAHLPPTPDTMSTAYVTANNGSNGSIAGRKSPKPEGETWFAGRPLARRRSADELTARRSFNGSDITDSMQTNCSDTPRISMVNVESPTFLPFNPVASKASELLGPGSPANPAIDPFHDSFYSKSKAQRASTVTPGQSPSKTIMSDTEASDSFCGSPPLTPQDWIAAAKHGPRSRKERDRGLRIEPRPAEPHNLVISQAAFHDDASVDSYVVEPEVADVPTLDLDTLDALEQPPITENLASRVGSPEPKQSRRLSFRPPFFNRSTNAGRRLESSPTAPDLMDEDDDGAPSPIIPKTRNAAGANRRPVSQIITNSNDIYYSSSVPVNGEAFGASFGRSKALHQPFIEAKESSTQAQAPSGPASAATTARPTTSHSVEHKRRSSLGIFGWMKGVSGKKSEPSTPVVAKFPESEPEPREQPTRASSRLAYDDGFVSSEDRPDTAESNEAPVVRPRSEMTMRSDETSRRPRYMGRRARRVN
ncbi:hypothetical protein N7454_001071 [Penicillium verhagenii]|nr:hypothetical protein N7454_001071 [Penicillium verhagenii]